MAPPSNKQLKAQVEELERQNESLRAERDDALREKAQQLEIMDSYKSLIRRLEDENRFLRSMLTSAARGQTIHIDNHGSVNVGNAAEITNGEDGEGWRDACMFREDNRRD